MTAITYETFKENFGDYKLEHLEGGVHPEYFYVAFYDEFIQPVVSSLFSEEDKKKWVQEWIEALDEDELEGKIFEEVLEEYDYLGEDITDFVVNSNLPNCAELKERFIQELFKEMTK